MYHKEEKKFFDIEQGFGPAVEYLIHNYPKYIPVKDLPLDDEDEKVWFVFKSFKFLVHFSYHKFIEENPVCLNLVSSAYISENFSNVISYLAEFLIVKLVKEYDGASSRIQIILY